MEQIETERGRLRRWRDDDQDAFSAMHADEAVMWDAVRPLSPAEAISKLNRYRAVEAEHGFSRWAMEDQRGEFLGYVGLLPIPSAHPRAPGVEIGWRFRRAAWGCGYATEGARVALKDGFQRLSLRSVLSYTAPDNLRSQAVMRRIGMMREEELDFSSPDGWRGWVWRASNPVA